MSAPETIALKDLESCFSGVVPATLATCSAMGVPNVAFLSIVRCVDAEHVALSAQFFNKTAKNLCENRRAQLLMVDPQSFEQYRLGLEFVRSETSGAVFDAMETQLAAVAAQVRMSDVFHLRGADVYRVLSVERLPRDLDLSTPTRERNHLAGLDAAARRLDAASDLEGLLERCLDGLQMDLGFDHSFLMLFDREREQLYAVASRGYDPSGVGAEIALGEGALGTAAERRRLVRIGHMERLRQMGRAVGSTTAGATAREVPLPGLKDVVSQLAVPVVQRGDLLGLLCVEDASPGAFTARDESTLSTLARVLGAQLRLLEDARSFVQAPSGRSYRRGADKRGPALKVEHYASDDSVFLDGKYLIKGLSGRILRKLLEAYLRDGRCEFSNRELRLDSTLGLSGYRDNLEARLILLRKRLEERSPTLRMEKAGRGLFRLQVDCAPELIAHK